MKGASSVSLWELLFCVALAERQSHAGAWKGGGSWLQTKIVKAHRTIGCLSLELRASAAALAGRKRCTMSVNCIFEVRPVHQRDE
jgi:hypothetical protein